MNLRDLVPAATFDADVRSLSSNSQDAGPGVLFFAVRGEKFDGHAFIDQALALGAIVVGETAPPAPAPGGGSARYVRVPDSRLALAEAAAAFYGHPSRKLKIVGVTGTSGKTTTSFLVESVLRAAGLRTGLLGTVAFRIDGREIPSTHTTPGPIELQKLLREMVDQGVQALAMEVSSHALKQHRSAGVAFDGVAFLNLSAEHLDYHPTMEDYYESKRILFREQLARSRAAGKDPRGVVNSDDEYGRKLRDELRRDGAIAAFSVPSDLRATAEGIEGTFGGLKLRSPLLGRFNAENIAAAVAVAQAIGIPGEAIRKGIESLGAIPGRLERVADPTGGRIVLVDYAHKPDAVEKVLKTLRPLAAAPAKIVTVIGCGGDRDRAKRPTMGRLACALSDLVVLTSDNPRTENPMLILREIEAGCAGFSNYTIEADRRLAIQRAIRQSGRGDVILIAGKGHEDYQIVGTEKVHFDDREEARAALKH